MPDDPGEEAPALFKAQMALVFAGTVVNIMMTPVTLGKAIGNGIIKLIAPRYSIYVLVFLRGLERALSWFQDLPPGYFYVLAHGNKNGPMRQRDDEAWEYIPLDELGPAISNSSYYLKGRPVVLISCEVGQGNFPRALCDKIGADVYASPDYVNAGLMTTPGRTTFPRLNWRVWRPK
jgi:hypothetical protein